MPELPALPLGSPDSGRRTTRATPRPTLRGPGPESQLGRLGPSFARLSAAFEAGRLQATEQPEAEPEQVLVLEVAGELSDFARAIGRVPGLEFLAEAAQDRVDSGDEFVAVDREGRTHRYDRQLYLVASDRRAWEEILSLWGIFQRGEQMPYGKAQFGHLFGRLESLRAWDDSDRLERTGALDAWRDELSDLGDELVDFEVELWFRRDPDRRREAAEELRADLELDGGEFVAESVYPEIAYHGVLARVSARRLRAVVESHRVTWLRTGAVRFFHAVGQFAATGSGDALIEASTEELLAPVEPTAEPPQVALLDGVPLAGHRLLEGRIVLDDPDGWEALMPAARRLHGTAMASIVVRGDLSQGSPVVRAPVYVRPILWDQAPAWVRGGREELPRDRLAVDLIHAAVARLFEGVAIAPTVKVIVLAVADAVCQFDRFVSPLARMLDWLQARFEIVILVAAGNHLGDLELPADLDDQDPLEVQHEILCTLQRETGMRRLLSPAESINALTIGAAHSDGATYREDDGRIEPIVTPDLPNVLSALGGGVRRAVKPDILLPGGRQLLTREPRLNGAAQRMSVTATRRPPGVRVAAPGRAGQVDATTYDTGTSPATGLAGYHAGRILETLQALRVRYGEEIAGPQFDAVIVKAALAHAASWGNAGGFIDEVCAELALGRGREVTARMIGYGRSEPTEVLACDDHRVTAVGAGRLAVDQAHSYRFPLPPSLASVTARRRLTLTLAWLTPVNPGHRAYRRAALNVEPGGLPGQFVERGDVEMYGARRGTLQHDILEGQRAVPYAPDRSIELVVSCRADAGDLDREVPYALIVTLEVPQDLGLRIYDEVRQALRLPVAVRVPGR